MNIDLEKIAELRKYRGVLLSDQYTALLDLAEEALKMRWQPIETASKDKRARLVWCPERMNQYVVRWDEYDRCWVHFGSGGTGVLEEDPTHWMPLPNSPEEPREHEESLTEAMADGFYEPDHSDRYGESYHDFDSKD